MAFDVSPQSYTRFMGRFSEPLAAVFADLAGVREGQRVLDVGCGPGALTRELVSRAGLRSVSAVDPSEPFVAAVRADFPGLDVQRATAERLPHDDGTFDLTLAQLVVHFMADPVAGLREMGRVTRPGGTVAACVWDHAGGGGPLSAFWTAARGLDPGAPDESGLAGTREGQLTELATAAGLSDVAESRIAVTVRFGSFEEWWQPFTLGVGPAGDHVGRLDAAERDRLRARCAEVLPPAPFDVTAAAWAIRSSVLRP